MARPLDSEPYLFHEESYDGYEQLRDEFEWVIPEEFNIAQYVCNRWAEHQPDRTAIIASYAGRQGHEYDFGEFHSITNQFANFLTSNGIEAGDRVGIYTQQRPENLFSHVSVWKLGGVSLPLSTLFGPDALKYRLEDSGAKAIVVDESLLQNVIEVRESLPDLEVIIVVGGSGAGDEVTTCSFEESIDGAAEHFETVSTTSEDDAMIIYTSGTTGDPKGALHAHRGFLGHIPGFLTTNANMKLRDDDRYWTPVEFAWIGSLFDIVFPALYYGVPGVVQPREKFDPERAFSLIEDYEITVCLLPPTSLRMMSRSEAWDAHDLDSIRLIASGGESLDQHVINWATTAFPNAAIHEGYGQTEADTLIGGCEALGVQSRDGRIGKPIPGHEVDIVDPETTDIVSPGTTGEIAVRYENDPCCFKRYWELPEETEGKIKNGWLLTEDLGEKDEDGYISFQGRKDDVILSAGYRVGPTEIEECLETHSAVAEAGVIGVPHEERGEVPKAFVVPTDGQLSPEIKDELKQHVRDQLAKYEYPHELESVMKLPRTSTGKLKRADLRDLEASGK